VPGYTFRKTFLKDRLRWFRHDDSKTFQVYIDSVANVQGKMVEMAESQWRCKLPNRSRDWLAQALRDLEQALSSQADGRHEWACFASQQAAEKAVKALHLAVGQQARSCMVARLLVDLPSKHPADLVEKGKVLDNFYIPTRYANGHSEGAPFEHYGSIQSEEAIRYACEILEFVSAQMAEANAGS
jgi:HEPN domain-containing protein